MTLLHCTVLHLKMHMQGRIGRHTRNMEATPFPFYDSCRTAIKNCTEPTRPLAMVFISHVSLLPLRQPPLRSQELWCPAPPARRRDT